MGDREGLDKVENVGDQRQNSRRWAVRKRVMVIAEGKADGRCKNYEAITKSWQRINEKMSNLVGGYHCLVWESPSFR